MGSLQAECTAGVPQGPQAVNPCFLQGFTTPALASCGTANVTGTGNYQGCVEAVKKHLLDKTAHCPVEPCSFDGTYQPQVINYNHIWRYSLYMFDGTYQP